MLLLNSNLVCIDLLSNDVAGVVQQHRRTPEDIDQTNGERHDKHAATNLRSGWVGKVRWPMIYHLLCLRTEEVLQVILVYSFPYFGIRMYIQKVFRLEQEVRVKMADTPRASSNAWW